ncbi:MAG: lamin tail domain-containing protein, partial [Myxococcota bacterium]|nr:lamin tail domain-containing protein [Myxococcota bacterium]
MLNEWTAPGVCRVEDGAPTCRYALQITDCAADGGRCDAGQCAGGTANPAPGELVFTEIMYDPGLGLTDRRAEWIELTSLSAARRSLRGCSLSAGDDASALDAFVVEPGAVVLL